MQVDVKLIPYDQEEKATFWVHKEDKGIQELEGYVESERFRSTVLTCQKGKDIYKINCREICPYFKICHIKHGKSKTI